MTYTLRFRHCVDDRNVWKFMMVRKWEYTKHGLSFREFERKVLKEDDGDYFVMDPTYILAYLRHFCKITASICREAWRQKKMKAILFAKLEHPRDVHKTLLKFKSFFCSHLFSLNSFRNVSWHLCTPIINVHTVLWRNQTNKIVIHFSGLGKKS